MYLCLHGTLMSTFSWMHLYTHIYKNTSTVLKNMYECINIQSQNTKQNKMNFVDFFLSIIIIIIYSNNGIERLYFWGYTPSNIRLQVSQTFLNFICEPFIFAKYSCSWYVSFKFCCSS